MRSNLWYARPITYHESAIYEQEILDRRKEADKKGNVELFEQLTIELNRVRHDAWEALRLHA
jgi:hypothetical protein